MTLAGQPSEKQDSGQHTLLMYATSEIYIKMAAPGSCNTRIKVASAELARPTNRASPDHVIRPLCG